MSPTLNLFALRTHAGFAANRPDVGVDSLSSFARLAQGMTKAGIHTPESLRNDAKALSEVLENVATLPGADAARIGEVRAEIKTLLN